MRYPAWLSAAVTLSWAIAALIAPAVSGEEPKSRAEQLKSILDDYDGKKAAFEKAAGKATTEAEARQSLKLKPSASECGKSLLALAKEKPADDVAKRALLWVVTRLDAPDLLGDALSMIEKSHLNAPELEGIIPYIGYIDRKRAVAFLETVLDKGTNKQVRGPAGFYLAKLRYEALGEAEDAKALAAIEALLERVKTDFADVKLGGELPLKDLASGLLFEMRHLRVGKAVPDIEGEGVDGKKFKLSEHKGKVVVLVGGRGAGRARALFLTSGS